MVLLIQSEIWDQIRLASTYGRIERKFHDCADRFDDVVGYKDQLGIFCLADLNMRLADTHQWLAVKVRSSAIFVMPFCLGFEFLERISPLRPTHAESATVWVRSKENERIDSANHAILAVCALGLSTVEPDGLLVIHNLYGEVRS